MTQRIPVVPVILAGGIGSRLWPLSRPEAPKQFLCFQDEQPLSLFERALHRCDMLDRHQQLNVVDEVVVGVTAHEKLITEQVAKHSVGGMRCMRPPLVITQPEDKGTATALTLAAKHVAHTCGDAVMIVMPSDHAFKSQEAVVETLAAAAARVRMHEIVLFGVEPGWPEAGFGYITSNCGQVTRFVEKPDRGTAKALIEGEGAMWNSGIFVMHAFTWFMLLHNFKHTMAELVGLSWAARLERSHRHVTPEINHFSQIVGDSIDCAVIQPCAETRPSTITMTTEFLKAGWSDLGSWDSVRQHMQRDDKGNARVGDVTMSDDCSGVLAVGLHGKLALFGLKDINVIACEGGVLVTAHDRSNDIRECYNELVPPDRTVKVRGSKDIVDRAWGRFRVTDVGDRFAVKRLTVRPGAALSLQLHHHRAEHWIVVAGTAEVTIDGATRLLTENQSAHIAVGQVHQLRNPGKVELILVEIQVGPYLAEDDIVRVSPGQMTNIDVDL